MTETTAASTHRQRVRAAFERAAPAYDGAAQVQRTAGDALAAFGRQVLQAAPLAATTAGIALDAGCGTGHGLAHLALLAGQRRTVALDLAPAMLRASAARAGPGARPALLCADLEQLPLAEASVALLWSSLAMQWCTPAASMREAARVLAGGGCALIATLGPRTLFELDGAFASVDSARHRNVFHDAAHWADQARAQGLQVQGVESRELHARAPELAALLKAIKTIGAATVTTGRRRAPLGARAWQRVQQAYEIHRDADGLLRATYDLVLLALRKPARWAR